MVKKYIIEKKKKKQTTKIHGSVFIITITEIICGYCTRW